MKTTAPERGATAVAQRRARSSNLTPTASAPRHTIRKPPTSNPARFTEGFALPSTSDEGLAHLALRRQKSQVRILSGPPNLSISLDDVIPEDESRLCAECARYGVSDPFAGAPS